MPKFVLGQLGPYSETVSKSITKQTKKSLNKNMTSSNKQKLTFLLSELIIHGILCWKKGKKLHNYFFYICIFRRALSFKLTFP